MNRAKFQKIGTIVGAFAAILITIAIVAYFGDIIAILIGLIFLGAMIKELIVSAIAEGVRRSKER